MEGEAQRQIARLLDLMATLRHPASGCPWDQVQTFDTIAPYTIEEAYEVADAIARRDMAALPDELGDLLFQVVYHAQMADEVGAFSFADVARTITDKMIRRHPNIFLHEPGASSLSGWDEQKAAERQARAETGTLAGIPSGLPALTRALKITKRAARVGFDWPNAALVLEKLDEEVAELRAELPSPDLECADPARLADELGDMLFVVANLARKLGLDPEACLQQANQKFTRRFNAVEQRLTEAGETPADATLEAMEAHWIAVKKAD
jgi:ATP diphosphatase